MAIGASSAYTTTRVSSEMPSASASARSESTVGNSLLMLSRITAMRRYDTKRDPGMATARALSFTVTSTTTTRGSLRRAASHSVETTVESSDSGDVAARDEPCPCPCAEAAAVARAMRRAKAWWRRRGIIGVAGSEKAFRKLSPER